VTLRPRFSPGLPLSVGWLLLLATKTTLRMPGLFTNVGLSSFFGNLAILPVQAGGRPMVLRLRFSPDLPLSEAKLTFFTA